MTTTLSIALFLLYLIKTIIEENSRVFFFLTPHYRRHKIKLNKYISSFPAVKRERERVCISLQWNVHRKYWFVINANQTELCEEEPRLSLPRGKSEKRRAEKRLILRKKSRKNLFISWRIKQKERYTNDDARARVYVCACVCMCVPSGGACDETRALRGVERRARVSLRCAQPPLCLFLLLCRCPPRELSVCSPSEKRRTATKPLRATTRVIYRYCVPIPPGIVSHDFDLLCRRNLGSAVLFPPPPPPLRPSYCNYNDIISTYRRAFVQIRI